MLPASGRKHYLNAAGQKITLPIKKKSFSSTDLENGSVGD